ncbi:MAG: triose-phosphate isomerase [Candidatus Latescibacteria bacterium]|nr:triose-phosphate isomerase [Candidatus Latescibacterota bacterium]NIO27278.1 triose-phosphate isomerase [Candidatus Latescibacterota bacterium]NIO54802.1 triose-phosphate isomerase [Candidatus Latescibacterota bacterium]NIT00885.1 triose-phosphate isomerase [Candidatus Latescibacterota bacterium]NIT37808.1 triose-phosphate isomerase [Candidatus Latescibacterota bacterium]
MPRRKLIAANWKMNKTISEAVSFVERLKSSPAPQPGCDLLIFPPFIAIPAVARLLGDTGVAVGAQDIFWENEGAFTGEISGPMIRDAGAEYALIGHSERRHVFGENDETVARKLMATFASGLRPILCVGETLEEREAGEAESTVEKQLRSALSALSRENVKRLVIAYEPVWAIGTGRTATPDDAEQMHAFIRRFVRGVFGDPIAGELIIQYGGSVKPDNAASLLEMEEIDGALVGGASLDADSFLAIAGAIPRQ